MCMCPSPYLSLYIICIDVYTLYVCFSTERTGRTCTLYDIQRAVDMYIYIYIYGTVFWYAGP